MSPSSEPIEASDLPNGLILFDGVCVLCSRAVQFVLERDRDAWFRFAPIQSPYGRALAQRLGIAADAPETNAVIVRGRACFKSDAALAVLQRLPRWSWSRILVLLPRALRDFAYDRLARNRYRLFGRHESCMRPTPDIAARFLFGDAGRDANDAEQDHTTDAAAAAAPPPAPADRRLPLLFRHLLGTDFARLPAAVRRVHALTHSLHTDGRAEVSTASGLRARLLCWLAGLPAAGRDIPVTVAFHPDGVQREFWQRRFGARHYASTMRAGDRRAPGCLVERFGLFDLAFRLTVRGDGSSASLAWSLVGWRLLGVSLPRWSAPQIECIERADGDRFMFDIDVTFPLIGHLVRYAGWLSPA